MPRVPLTPIVLCVLLPVVPAALGTWFASTLSLDILAGVPWSSIFLALYLGSAVGVAVAYYGFRLDVMAGG